MKEGRGTIPTCVGSCRVGVACCALLLLLLCNTIGARGASPSTSADCLLSACQFASTQTLHPQEWRAGECRHHIPIGSRFYWTVTGNVSVYLFKQNAMFDFRRGGKISSLLPRVASNNNVLNGNFTFTTDMALGNGGIYFVVYNGWTDTTVSSYEAGFVVQPVSSGAYWPCSNYTTRASCEAVVSSGTSCVWCANPCACMTEEGAADDCPAGWDARYLEGSIVVPDFNFDAWDYAGTYFIIHYCFYLWSLL